MDENWRLHLESLPTKASSALCWRNLKMQLVQSIPHQNRAFHECSSHLRNFNTLALHFSEEHFENKAFWIWCHDNHLITLTKFSSKRNQRWPMIVLFLNCSSVVWTKNIWWIFEEQMPLSNFSNPVWARPNGNEFYEQRLINKKCFEN